MTLEASNARYSPVNSRHDAATAASVTVKSRDTVNDDGYLRKVKLFLSTASPNKISKTSNKCNYPCAILITLGFILSLLLTMFMWFTDLYTSELYKRLTIQNGSLLFDSWKDLPVKPLLCVYVLNYTNVNQFIAGEQPKLRVQEIGPYCYRETIHKINIVDHKNGSQTYSEMRSQEFDYEASNGSDLDMITVPDIPLISAIAMINDQNFLVRSSVSWSLNQASDSPFVTVNVYDFCFGYQNDVIRTLSTLAKLAKKPVPFEKFGLLMKRIGVSTDRITVNNGQNDLNEMGEVSHLNGKSMLYPWKTDACNAVGGSEGMLFPRESVKHGQSVYLFHKDSCRKLQFTFRSKEKLSNGVIGHLYTLAPNAFNNSLPENSCYCTRQSCAPDGTFDVGPCSSGSPVILSRAHFLNSDPALLNAIDGLNPDPEKHDLLWLIDPLMGITMETKMRIQLNIQVRNPNGYGALSKIADNTILPITWLDIRSGDVSPGLKMLLFHLTYTLQWVQMFLMCLSLVGLLITSFFMMRMMTRRLKSNIAIISHSHEVQPMNRTSDKIPI